jgi:hypothetical protein
MECDRRLFDAVKTAVVTNGAESVPAIDRAVAALMGAPNPACIRPLLLLLDDTAEYEGGMFSLIHAAENFPDEVYVEELLPVLPDLQATAPRWASILLMRLLNNSASRDAFVRRLRAASQDVKDAVASLCTKINETSRSFMTRTIPVLAAAK